MQGQGNFVVGLSCSWYINRELRMNDYTQNVKNIARSELIQNAIKILTSERHNSTIATRNYVREVKSCLLNRDHQIDVKYAQTLADVKKLGLPIGSSTSTR